MLDLCVPVCPVTMRSREMLMAVCGLQALWVFSLGKHRTVRVQCTILSMARIMLQLPAQSASE